MTSLVSRRFKGRPAQRWSGMGMGLVLAALLLAPVFGLASAFLPWSLVVGAVLVSALMVVPAVYPLLGVLGAVALLFEVVPESFQPSFPLGGARLTLYDFAVIYLIGLMVFAGVLRKHAWWSALREFRWPLLYLAVAAAASLAHVYVAAPNTGAFSQARHMLLWTLIPLILWAVPDELRFRRFLAGILAVSLVVALYVTLQTGLDIRIMTAARVEQLDAGPYADVVRSLAGGAIYLIVFCIFFLANRLIEGRFAWWWAVPMIALLCLGLGVQFGRGVWIASFLGLLLSAALFRGVGGVAKVGVIALVVGGVAFAALTAVKPRVAEAMVERVTGIQREIETGGSFGWRQRENAAARAKILENPVFGVGIGGDYKPAIGLRGGFDADTSYIHNGYLYFPLKMGLWASLIPFAFMAAFAVCMHRYRRAAGAAMDRGLAAALTGAFVVPLITCYTQPEWSSPKGIAAFSIFMAMALLLRQFAERRANTAAATQGAG